MIDLSLRDRARDRPVAEAVRRPYLTSTLSCELAQLVKDDFFATAKIGRGKCKGKVRANRSQDGALHSFWALRCPLARRWQVIRGHTGAEPCEKRTSTLLRLKMTKDCTKFEEKNIPFWAGKCAAGVAVGRVRTASTCISLITSNHTYPLHRARELPRLPPVPAACCCIYFRLRLFSASTAPLPCS